MLDEKGIRLAEIDKRYPRIFQYYGYDPMLNVDALHKPKLVSTFQMIVNSILQLLFMKPGQYPSIPELGIDIEQYLHEYADDPKIVREIKKKLYEQCNVIEASGVTFECVLDKTDEGVPALLITITGEERIAYGSKSNRVIIGITYDKLNQLYSKTEYV